MPSLRFWIALACAASAWGASALPAQELPTGGAGSPSSGSSGTSSPGSSSTGFGSGTGTSAPPPAASSFGTPSTPATPSSPSFTGTTPSITPTTEPALPGTTPEGLPTVPAMPAMPTLPGMPTVNNPGGASTPGNPSGASSAFGADGSQRRQTEEPTVFNIPGTYGAAPTTLTAGQGRLARPRYRTTGSFTIGLDDNVSSTPFNAQEVPAVTQEVVVEAAVPERRYSIFVFPSGRGGFFGERPIEIPIVIPAIPEKTKTEVVVPAIPPTKRTVSVVARANAGFQMQFASRRTVFTMDLNASSSFYTNRPDDQVDYNGSLIFSFLHRLTSRLTLSASANVAYLSQPDISRVNTPIGNTGDYFNGSFKMDLGYRWTKRFDTRTSLSINSTLYPDAAQESSSFQEMIVGTEGTYLLSPRLSALGEIRFGMVTYDMDATRDSRSVYLLFGGQFRLSRRISGSVRLGTQTRIFEVSGDASTGPFGETLVTWRYSPAGGILWSTRLGYEEPPDSLTTVTVLRTTLSVQQAFNARLSANAGLSLVQNISEREGLDSTATTSMQIDAGMQYTLSRNVTLTGTYNFTGNLSTVSGANYIRNQIFFGVQYSF